MKENIIKCIATTLTLLYLGNTQNVRIMKFNPDGIQRNNTYVSYSITFRVGQDSTLCLRFRIGVFRLLTAVAYLMAVHDSDDDPMSFEVYFEKIRTKYGGYGRFYPLPQNLATNTWYHYCQIRDVRNKEGRVYIDGQLIVKEKVDFAQDTFERELFIGQDVFQAPYSLAGDLSQVNVWKRALSDDEIISISLCNSNLLGDVVSWEGKWNLSEVVFEEIPLKLLCEETAVENMPVSLPRLRFGEAVTSCIGLGGTISVPSSPTDLLNELEMFEGDSNCDRQWGPLTDMEEEGVWKNPFSGKRFSREEVLFRDNNPDGDKYQNCLRINQKGLEDTECQKSSCTKCSVDMRRTWTLRGICEEEERMYYFDLIPTPLAYKGYGEYFIREIDNRWEWVNLVTNMTLAIYEKDEGELIYPIGRKDWILQASVCDDKIGSKRTLALSSCGIGNFTCTDGSCVNFGSRCDLKFDCLDKSDESFCDIINYPADYRSKLPPRPTTGTALPIAINVSIDTLSINTEKMLLSASYKLAMTWFDNRLTFNNIKSLTRLNTLGIEQLGHLWNPEIGFINTDDIQHTYVDSSAVTTIIREDNTFVRDLSNSYEVRIFRGDSNAVSSSRKYFTIFTCNFDLLLYPFDIQHCVMILQVQTASNEYIVFNFTNSFIQYLGPQFLVEYGIGELKITVDNSTQYSEARVSVELIRRYGYAMMNIYIPSLTLIVISYVTLFIRPKMLEVRVMTALTSLLVLATLFTQVSASLPKTSYFKMVDIWLLFCILLIFIIIIFHAVIDSQIDYGDFSPLINTHPINKVTIFEKRPSTPQTSGMLMRYVKKIMESDTLIAVSRVFVLVLFLIFNCAYWGKLYSSSGLTYTYTTNHGN